jgi:23S rRNA U2552 (ribose-2'-O)-methylase RlmE/FtsJ
MTYYLLPRTPIHIYKFIDYVESDNIPIPAISNSLASYLYEIKQKIDVIEKDWNIFKKYTNPYEYINTIVPYKKKSISKNKHLSRSYFKMVEILDTFDIYFEKPTIRTFHLAEGPGGFIEAVIDNRKTNEDMYVGMTLLEDKNEPNIPSWKQSENFLKKNPNVFIETGIDNTGNILSLDNFVYCSEKYESCMDLITADGGFDFSVDFNKQELNISQLLFAQICFAITMQRKGGVFVLKLFDCFMQHTVDLLYILAAFYEKVYIYKPNTSRFANSEKYVVCKGFLFYKKTPFFPFLHRAFEKMVDVSNKRELYVKRFITVPISYNFLLKLEEYNAIFGQKQIENIYFTISLIDNTNKQKKIDNLISVNIQKCIHWCIKYGIEYNVL